MYKNNLPLHPVVSFTKSPLTCVNKLRLKTRRSFHVNGYDGDHQRAVQLTGRKDDLFQDINDDG